MTHSLFRLPPFQAVRWVASRLRTILFPAILVSLGMSAHTTAAQTYNEQTLHNFAGGTTDGYQSSTPLLAMDVSGTETLFGTTAFGGTADHGVIFSINPITHAETILHSFQGGSADGADGRGSLINVGGTIYGTTIVGGPTDAGTLFSMNPNGTGYQVLYSFSGGDGAYPFGILLADGNTLYGTTEQGGNGLGTVFSFNLATHHLKTLYSFQTITGEGSYPEAGLIEAGGVLIGTTVSGGYNSGNSNGFGTIFSLNTDGTNFKTLYKFAGRPNDGEEPRATLLDLGGTIYGTTTAGGSQNDGTVFSFDVTQGTDKILHSFLGSSDGQYADSGLLDVGGALYGTTDAGSPSSNGMVYSINPDGTGYQSRYNFTATQTGQVNSDGGDSQAGLIALGGTLYGTTYGLGTNADGTVFALTPSNATAPIATSDKYAVKYQTNFAVKAPGILSNDTSGGSGPVTATLISGVTHGSLSLSSDGSFGYTPSPGFVGTDTFTYQAVNPIGKSNTATVSLIVQAVVPTAHNDAYFPIYSHAYKVNAPGVLANDYAGDTGSLTAKLVSSVSHGTLTLNSDGSFLYSPTFEYSGTDSFTYTATNAIGTSNTATVTFTINPVVPIAHNDAYAPKYATAYGVSAPGVLGNDDDGGTSPMTAALVSSVTHGTLTFSSNGSFTYTPSAGFIGTDTFTYNDTTPTGTGNTATVTLNVTATVPIAHNDSYSVGHNKAYAVKAPGVLGNDYNGDAGTLTASLVTTTAHGILTFNTDGSFNYTPATGYSGTDTFTYQAKNAIGTSNIATVTLTVQ